MRKIKMFLAIALATTTSLHSHAQIVINEYCSSSTSFLDEDGDNNDWIELYNTTDAVVNLEGWSLSDKATNLAKWVFPSYDLPAKSYLLVFASGKDRLVANSTSYFHTNFNISADGEVIYLADNTGKLVHKTDSVVIPNDASCGLVPNGSGQWKFFAEPTPKSANTTKAYSTAKTTSVTFSPRGGLITAATTVTLKSENNTPIYYTLDCTEPTKNSTLYTGPIKVEKSTVIRAITFNDNLMQGLSETQSYIFASNLSWKKRNRDGSVSGNGSATHASKFDLPVFSLTTAPNNLWDKKTGIYVLGENAQGNEPYYGANFHEDWERPIYVEFYGKDGKQLLSQNAGVKIAGAYSRKNDQKSLAIHARRSYGKNRFDCKLFESLDIDSFKSFVLRSSGNDFQNTHIRDAVITGLVRNNNVDIQAYQPAVVFLNGEYWGILNIREKLNEDYIENHYPQYKADDVDILVNDMEVNEGSDEHFRAMWNYISANDMSNDGCYEYVSTQMEIDEYIEYMVAQIYCRNKDWPHNNLKYWRAHDNGARWRWFLYDTDHGFGIWDNNNTGGGGGGWGGFGGFGGWGGATVANHDYNYNMLTYCLAPSSESNQQTWPNFLLRNMVENANFKRDFVNRFADRFNNEFDPVTVHELIDSLDANISSEIGFHNQRWNCSESYRNERLEIMKTFADNRPENVREHLINQFNVGASVNVTINTNNSKAGYVQLNSLTLKHFPWVGEYFTKNEISIRAIARPGYKFVKWEETSAKTPQLNVKVSSATTFTAVFEEDAAEFNSVVINEINYKSSDKQDTKDWVELFNTTAADIDLSNWVLTDSENDKAFKIPVGTIIPAYGYIVVCENRNKLMKKKFWPELTNAIGDFRFGLGLTDVVRLFDNEGALIDEVAYDCAAPWPTGTDGDGYTLSLVDPFADNSQPSAWERAELYGSPGAQNDNYYSTHKRITDIDEKEVSDVDSYVVCAPNPFTNYAEIYWLQTTNAEVTIELMSAQGQVLAICNEWFAQGRNSFDISRYIGEWNEGLYFARITIDGEQQTIVKLIKQ